MVGGSGRRCTGRAASGWCQRLIWIIGVGGLGHLALHQAGAIPANSYAVDLDAVAANTGHLMGEATSLGLTVYAMTKQLGRAPGVLKAISDAGADRYVAVDMACARPIAANGHHLGHIGHLVQVPAAETSEAMAMEPDYWTVFSPNKASEASAAGLGVEQTQRVLDLIVNLRDQGVAVLLITHNMDRVLAVCDQAVVLYQGRKHAEEDVADVSKDNLVSYITGARSAD